MRVFAIIFISLCWFGEVRSQVMSPSRIGVKYTQKDFPITDLNNDSWFTASEVLVDNYWSGVKAPAGRHFTARLIWSDAALFVRFEADRSEPLIVSDKPILTSKTLGLWDRDVYEIFVAPNKNARNTYFEFEIAPTGEWIDLGITLTPKKRLTDLNYSSGMTSSAHIDKEKVVMAIRVEWKAFGKVPKAKDVWLGNILRCVGKDPTRGYLSWQATKTNRPSFHVPSKFGEFEFMP